jgi:DNA-binding NarL/FixJ family response regulator
MIETTWRGIPAIRVLLADDHPLVRAGVRAALMTESDVTLVGEATDGYQAWRLCQELAPDVLLLDLNMPGPAPVETATYVRERHPGTKVLVLSAYDDDAYVRGLVGAGVAGYVLKDEAPEVVVNAVRAVVRGGTWFSRPVVEKLIACGWSNAHIAAELSLAEQTVRNYASRVYAKLEVSSRTEAMIRAREYDLAR